MTRPALAVAFALALGGAPLSAQQPALAGTFTAGPFALAFERDTVRISRGGQVGIVGYVELRADTVTFRDVSGPIACNPSFHGRYLWKLDGSTLAFTLISDECSGRAGLIPGRGWTRQSESLVLSGITLIDGSGAPARPAMTIVISDGKIADLFPDGSRPLPPGARVRALPGRFVIPGLIDTHVHLATDPSGDDARDKWIPKLRQTLLGGVTSVRDMAGDARALAELSRATRVGDLVGPAIYYSALFAGPRFFADPRVVATSRGAEIGQAPWARAVTDSTDWRQVIAEAKGTGASGIKLYADLDAGLLGPLTAEAHRQGLKVWAHATLLPARPRDLVGAGVDVLSHAPLLAREADTVQSGYRERYRVNYAGLPASHPAMVRLIGELAAGKTIVEPTLYVFFSSDSITPPARWAGEITRELNRHGVPIAAGTDGLIGVEGDTLASGAVLPNLHRELELLVQYGGLTPSQAIVAATATAARTIGIESHAGTVAVGKDADLVVLTADPLTDISNTRRIELVVQRGKIQVRD
jgi:imidazolonepropionase-like amidohydrolase